MKNITRRQLLISGALSFGSLSLRSLVTGLPVSFLMNLTNPAMAATSISTDYKYLILSHQQRGDPLNANAPGTYADDPNDANDNENNNKQATVVPYKTVVACLLLLHRVE